MYAIRSYYAVTQGEVSYIGRDLLALPPEERAREGIFLAFQYPVEIPGVANIYLLKAALNALRKHRGEAELDAMDFLALVRDRLKLMGMDEALLVITSYSIHYTKLYDARKSTIKRGKKRVTRNKQFFTPRRSDRR